MSHWLLRPASSRSSVVLHAKANGRSGIKRHGRSNQRRCDLPWLTQA